jgi:hypothetical protein
MTMVHVIDKGSDLCVAVVRRLCRQNPFGRGGEGGGGELSG